MSNNTPDYDDNLVFPPRHDKTAYELQKRVNELEKEVERKQKFINARESSVFSEELYKLQEAKIVELASLLKECRKHLQVEVYNPETGAVYNSIANLLTRIDASIGESEK